MRSRIKAWTAVVRFAAPPSFSDSVSFAAAASFATAVGSPSVLVPAATLSSAVETSVVVVGLPMAFPSRSESPAMNGGDECGLLDVGFDGEDLWLGVATRHGHVAVGQHPPGAEAGFEFSDLVVGKLECGRDRDGAVDLAGDLVLFLQPPRVLVEQIERERRLGGVEVMERLKDRRLTRLVLADQAVTESTGISPPSR